MQELVFQGQNNQALTNSLLVAEKFGKKHYHVTDAIKNLLSSHEKSGQFFLPSTYIDNSGKENPMYVMNRDGFTLLAMGFTGKKALQFKMDYITAFNAMENKLKELQKPLSHLEILVQSAQALLEHQNRISNVEQRLNAMEQEREENTKQLLSVSASPEQIPEMSLRDNIRQLVNKYSSSANIKQQDVWHKIYDQLYYLYHISIKAYKKSERESLLDVAQRNRLLDKIYTIISNMARELKQRA